MSSVGERIKSKESPSPRPTLGGKEKSVFDLEKIFV